MTGLKWWQKAVFYQIYPRSFADGNGDGIGDLAGMIGKLDYLKDLGIDAIWLSPHYPSPLYDVGYDVSDYTGVAPEYGRLEEFKTFLDEAHRRGIRLVLDLVLNHTSDAHAWFTESRSSRENPRRDWYIWKDGKNGEPPNNWFSMFGGPAWEYDALTESYYYHFFFKEQPDLNWRNPQVKQAMFDAARFWLDMGVDGFRLDAIPTIYEDPELTPHTSQDTPAELYRAYRLVKTPEDEKHYRKLWEHVYHYQHDMPEVHDLMKELRAVVDEYDERVLIGETDQVKYYGSGDDELHMVFNFPLMRTRRITPEWVRSNQKKMLSSLPAGAWPANTLNNHDTPRMFSEFGDGEHDGELARLNLGLMLTLWGTPFLYNGEEIGMTDYLLSELGKFKDNLSVWAYGYEIELMHSTPEEAVEYAARRGRDKCRTPMQWKNAPNAGFCPADVEPWLPVNPNYAGGVNVEEQQDGQGSLLCFYRDLLAVRRRSPALIGGEYTAIHPGASQYLAFLRTSPEQKCLVVLNYSDQPLRLKFDETGGDFRLVFSSHERARPVETQGEVELSPFEVYIAEY